MALDFEDMEKKVIAEYPDEKEEILAGIEKLKANDDIIGEIDKFIYARVWDAFTDDSIGDGTPYEKVCEIAFDHFLENHPELDPDEAYGSEAHEEFTSKIFAEEDEESKALLLDFKTKAYESLDDDVTDELRRTATSDSAEEFDLHYGIIAYLANENWLPNALLQ